MSVGERLWRIYPPRTKETPIYELSTKQGSLRHSTEWQVIGRTVVSGTRVVSMTLTSPVWAPVGLAWYLTVLSFDSPDANWDAWHLKLWGGTVTYYVLLGGLLFVL